MGGLGAFPMELILTAALGELTSRTVSFLIDRYSSRPTSPDMEEKLQSLQRLLGRICMVIEAAEGRHITSQAMLRQLESMRKAMYRGYYTLDTFRVQTCHGPEETIGDEGSDNGACRQRFTLSRFNPAKRLLLSTPNEAETTSQLQLQQVLYRLSTVLTDATEFIVLLNTYPPLYRQPYSTYLFLDVCMFGRQMELERVVSFLLQVEEPPTAGMGNPCVLPIVGSYGVGKSTLVAHVCNDERVRGHFSRIVWFSEDDFNKDGVTTFMDGGILKHEQDNGKDTWLVVVSVPGDIDEVAWRRLYQASATGFANNSKIIITSQSNQVMNFGTTEPLILDFLAEEAYWYFFKALAFGSADPGEHPKLVAIAMKVAMVMKIAGVAGSFMRANFVATMLRNNFNVGFWRKVLAYVTDNYRQRYHFLSYEHSHKWRPNRHMYFSKKFGVQHCVFHNFRTSGTDEEIPSVKFIDMLSRRVQCCVGRHEVLVWKGRLPPYKNYIMSCDIQKPAA